MHDCFEIAKYALVEAHSNLVQATKQGRSVLIGIRRRQRRQRRQRR